MKEITSNKTSGPLISAVLMVLAVTLTTMWPVLELISLTHKLSYLIISPFYLVDAMVWGCVIYLVWYFVLQKYQRNFPLWCYCLIPLVYLLVYYVITQLPSLKVILGDQNNSLWFYIYLLIMAVLLIGQYLYLKKLALSKLHHNILIILTLLSICLIIVSSVWHVGGMILPVSLYVGFSTLLPTIISFLVSIAVLYKLASNLKAEPIPIIQDIVSIRFAFLIAMIGLDGAMVTKVIKVGIFSYLFYILMAFAIVKVVYIWKFTQKIQLPIQPLYILWSLLLATFFSYIILFSISCVIVACFYVWSYSLFSMKSEAAGWFILFWFIPLPFIFPIINLLMTSFSLKLFFAKKTE